MINWFEKHNKISWTITVIIAIIIFYISSLTFEQTKILPQITFKSIIYHFFMFFLLCFFLLISVKTKKIEFILIIILVSMVYGILDEFHQLFVLGRACSLSDFLIDSFGILLAGMIYSFRLKNNINY